MLTLAGSSTAGSQQPYEVGQWPAGSHPGASWLRDFIPALPHVNPELQVLPTFHLEDLEKQ